MYTFGFDTDCHTESTWVHGAAGPLIIKPEPQAFLDYQGRLEWAGHGQIATIQKVQMTIYPRGVGN